MNWQTPSSTTVSWSKRKILSKRHLFGVVATEQRVRITWQQTLHSVLFSAQHVYIYISTNNTNRTTKKLRQPNIRVVVPLLSVL